MVNGRPECMVATVMLAMKSTVVRSDLHLADVLPHVLYGYRRRRRGVVPSLYRLMYGIEPRMVANDWVALRNGILPRFGILELLGESGNRAL